MNKKAKIVWKNCLEFIEDSISPQAYKTWFEPIIAVGLAGPNLSIQVPSKFFYEWLEEHYVKLLKVALTMELGADAKLTYVIKMNKGFGNDEPFSKEISSVNLGKVNPQEVNTSMKDKSPELKNPFIIPGISNIKIESQLNPNYSFDNFLEGESNRLARSAGLAVANKPGGTSFNPFLVFGGVGLGKTHLAHAIGVDIKENYPEKTVLYISAEKFAQQYIDSVKKNNRNDFIHFYQIIDVLIVDDIQLLSGKAGTQDVFFHVFNHLHQNGKQIILTSDKAPVNMNDIEPRLLSRFKWGISAELNHPDYDTRIAIIKNKLYRDGVEMPEDIVEFLANNIKTNIRELEGAIISLIAHSSFNKREITIDLAKKIVDNYVKNKEAENFERKLPNDNDRTYKHLIEMSDLLRNAFLKYLINFDEYVRDTKGILLEFQTRKNKKGIELEVTLDAQTSIEKVEEYLDEYVGLVAQNEPNVKDKMEIDEFHREIEFLEVKYELQVSQFKNDIRLADYKIKHLKEEVAYFRGVHFSRANEPVTVNLNLNQIQSQGQEQEQEQSQIAIFGEEDLTAIRDAFGYIRSCINDPELVHEANDIQDDLDALSPENIENLDKKGFKRRLIRFFSKLKQGLDGITWASKTLESFLKGREALQKFVNTYGVDIKDIIEYIDNAFK